MGPGDLSSVLAPLASKSDPRLLVGRETFDDAGVFLIADDLALVQTVDFFAPVVDDPFDFGQVAAANALSDVYAMGGQPMTALSIVAYPTNDLPLSVLTEILRGGQEKVHEAGAFIVGGHTVIDTELKYGLAVTGRAHPKFLLTNAAAKPCDRLVLTKAIGNGILATALKREIISADAAREMIELMKKLNGQASRAALAVGALCATDVTGFGLLGHASHIARASNVTLAIHAELVPVLNGARDALKKGATTDGMKRNREYVDEFVEWRGGEPEDRDLFCDPQTSGGLLVAVPPARVSNYLSKVEGAVDIGEVLERETIAIVVD